MTVASIDWIIGDWTEINSIFVDSVIYSWKPLSSRTTHESRVSSKAMYFNCFIFTIYPLKVFLNLRLQESNILVPISCIISYLDWMDFNYASDLFLNLVNPFWFSVNLWSFFQMTKYIITKSSIISITVLLHLFLWKLKTILFFCRVTPSGYKIMYIDGFLGPAKNSLQPVQNQ